MLQNPTKSTNTKKPESSEDARDELVKPGASANKSWTDLLAEAFVTKNSNHGHHPMNGDWLS